MEQACKELSSFRLIAVNEQAFTRALVYRRRAGRDRRGVGDVVRLERHAARPADSAPGCAAQSAGARAAGRRVHVGAGSRDAQLQQPARSATAAADHLRRRRPAIYRDVSIHHVIPCAATVELLRQVRAKVRTVRLVR